MRLSIAIDGPAGAGKSTIAKILAKRFNIMYINTGAMYRAVTLKALQLNILPEDKDRLINLIDSLDMCFENDDLIVNNENVTEQICLPNISNNVSNFAAVPEVRQKLVKLQRKMAEKYDVVMDGRDIGTVVLNKAPFKFYLTASPEERAKRRYTELCLKGISVNYDELLSDIIKRDYIDSNRETDPLMKADDAVEIDSSALTINDVVDKMYNYIKEANLKMNNEQNLEMNEQLAFMEQNNSTITVGKKVRGTLISVNEREAFVNLGYKSDGYLPKEEVTKTEGIKLTDLFKVGEEIEAKVISRNNEDGYVVLSRIEFERENAFKDIKSAYENKNSIKVTVREAVTGGLVANYKGIRVFIPASHIELLHVNNLDQYIGNELEIKIIEFKEERRTTKIVGSRRDLLKSKKSELEELTWSTLQAGDKVTGEVKRLTDFGAFIEVNGVDGLLHVSEISWGRIEKPSKVLKIGDKVEVYILEADKENKKLSLSIKRLTEDPWINVDVKYPVGSVALGKVVRFAGFGAFIELEPGVDALVHISQISHKRIEKPQDALQIGQLVKAKIVDVNKETKKIGLSIKEVEDI